MVTVGDSAKDAVQLGLAEFVSNKLGKVGWGVTRPNAAAVSVSHWPEAQFLADFFDLIKSRLCLGDFVILASESSDFLLLVATQRWSWDVSIAADASE